MYVCITIAIAVVLANIYIQKLSLKLVNQIQYIRSYIRMYIPIHKHITKLFEFGRIYLYRHNKCMVSD